MECNIMLVHNKHYSLELLISDKGQGVLNNYFFHLNLYRCVKISNYFTIWHLEKCFNFNSIQLNLCFGFSLSYFYCFHSELVYLIVHPHIIIGTYTNNNNFIVCLSNVYTLIYRFLN